MVEKVVEVGKVEVTKEEIIKLAHFLRLNKTSGIMDQNTVDIVRRLMRYYVEGSGM